MDGSSRPAMGPCELGKDELERLNRRLRPEIKLKHLNKSAQRSDSAETGGDLLPHAGTGLGAHAAKPCSSAAPTALTSFCTQVLE